MFSLNVVFLINFIQTQYHFCVVHVSIVNVKLTPQLKIERTQLRLSFHIYQTVDQHCGGINFIFLGCGPTLWVCTIWITIWPYVHEKWINGDDDAVKNIVFLLKVSFKPCSRFLKVIISAKALAE